MKLNSRRVAVRSHTAAVSQCHYMRAKIHVPSEAHVSGLRQIPAALDADGAR